MALWKYHSFTKLPSNHIKQASLDPNHNLVYHPDPEHGLLRLYLIMSQVAFWLTHIYVKLVLNQSFQFH